MGKRDSVEPFGSASTTVLDQVDIQSVEGNLEDHDFGLELGYVDLPSNYELQLTIYRDRMIPGPVLTPWLNGKNNDVHMVTGIGRTVGGGFYGGITPSMLRRLYLNIYPGYHIKVELAYPAGASWMAYYRVWISERQHYTEEWVKEMQKRRNAPVTKRIGRG